MSARKLVYGFALLLSTTVGVPAAQAQARSPEVRAGSCESLAGVALPETRILSAAVVAAGEFTQPDGKFPVAELPAFCRVVAVAKTTINFEVWLPVENWNGKFQGVGNGGTAGFISYGSMETALRHGYAVTSTDTGHVNHPAGNGFDSSWALGRPELVAEYGYLGLHLATAYGKQIARAFYGKNPAHSYYVGCSKGGGQGLMEAQRYPEDYDGILAGDPANDFTGIFAGAHLWYSMATLKDAESYIPAGKVKLLADAVTAACDAQDGIKDGVLDDPRQCRFDPGVLTCKAGEDVSGCFSAKQVQAVRDIWAGGHDASGKLIFPGLVPGGEDGSGGWAGWVTGSAPFQSTHYMAAEGTFRYMVFQDAKYNVMDFNFASDLELTRSKLSASVDAVDADLRPLQKRGAKLLLYHGWSDPDLSPLNTINYYERVVATVGKDSPDFVRLFMVPGMQHCGGGPGPNHFDALTALEQWVEDGIAPTRIVAFHMTDGAVDRTRPLCAYPEVAVYSGKGSTNDAANFSCAAPRH